MKGLGADTRALLARARRAQVAPDAVRQRGRERLLGAIACGSVTSTALVAEASVLGAKGGLTVASLVASAAKAFVVGSSVGLVVATAVVSLTPPRPAAESGSTPVALAPTRSAKSVVPSAAPSVLPEPSASLNPVPEFPSVASTPQRASIARETALLADVQLALGRGQPGQALALLDRYQEEFPRGHLFEEATASRVVALCALGRTADGLRWTAEFLRLYPRSPLVKRVRKACPGAE